MTNPEEEHRQKIQEELGDFIKYGKLSEAMKLNHRIYEIYFQEHKKTRDPARKRFIENCMENCLRLDGLAIGDEWDGSLD